MQKMLCGLAITVLCAPAVEKPDAFGADWLVRLSIAPVIGLPWG